MLPVSTQKKQQNIGLHVGFTVCLFISTSLSVCLCKIYCIVYSKFTPYYQRANALNFTYNTRSFLFYNLQQIDKTAGNFYSFSFPRASRLLSVHISIFNSSLLVYHTFYPYFRTNNTYTLPLFQFSFQILLHLLKMGTYITSNTIDKAQTMLLLRWWYKLLTN